MPKKLLIVDDETGHRQMVRAVMENEGWTVAEADSAEKGLASLDETEADVVLMDWRMPGMGGQEGLKQMVRRHPQTPVVMLTAFGTVDSAVEAMKQGAFDYLSKPADNEELWAVLEKASKYGALLKENARLKERLDRGGQGPDMVGSGRAMRAVKTLIEQAAPSEATVLVTGESGTGKELVADALHAGSLRAGGPLVKVNCAALPGELLESELFGHEKGAFTGAVKTRAGRFQLASGGTLFLDEVGELPLELQAKILRALQERVVEPLGGMKPVPVDVRLVAATNRDLAAMVKEGTFREDLYYRLNVLEVHVPPLRERHSDIPALVSHLLARLSAKNHREPPTVTPEFLDALVHHDWPGNVRELENVLERALVLSRSANLTPETLPPGFGAGHGAGEAGHASFEEAEKATLIRALAAHGGHRERTAEALGVSRRTLQYKLKKYGLTRRASEV